jgi:hypothetical protein
VASTWHNSALGTAEAIDVTVQGSPLSFVGTAGETHAIDVVIRGDGIVEDNETFTITLGDVTGTSASQDASITTGAVSDGLINNDDGRQIVIPIPTSQTAFVGDSFTFDVIYTNDPLDEMLPGLGLRLHFNSTQVQFDGLSNVLQTNLFLSESISDDTENFDADPATDMFVSVAWTDIGGGWPGVGNLPATLYTANFTALVVGTATMNFSDSDTAGGFVLDATSAEVMITISLDVDNNGEATALTDGVLIVRYLFGVTGTQLTDGLLGTGALRTDPVEIISFLDGFLPAAASASIVVTTQDVLIANYHESSVNRLETPSASRHFYAMNVWFPADSSTFGNRPGVAFEQSLDWRDAPNWRLDTRDVTSFPRLWPQTTVVEPVSDSLNGDSRSSHNEETPFEIELDEVFADLDQLFADKWEM